MKRKRFLNIIVGYKTLLQNASQLLVNNWLLAYNLAYNLSEMKKNSLTLFAHSYWDAIPVSWGLLHFAYFIGMLVGFSYLPWWANLMTGLFYAFSISWNVNSVSHNFIHNAYFNSNILNRAFSLLE